MHSNPVRVVLGIVAAALVVVDLSAAETDTSIPFVGDEVSVVRLKAYPEKYVGKTFYLCGGVTIHDYYNYGYRNAKHTHYALRFREVGKDNKLLASGRTVMLYLSREVEGSSEIIEEIIRSLEKSKSTNTYKLVRARVTLSPSRYKTGSWNFLELLDAQFVTEGGKAWQPGIVEKSRDEKKGEAEEALFRTWSDSTGKFSIAAKFLEFKNGKAILERKDNGKKIELSTSRLSKEDQQWVRDEIRQRREKQKTPTKKADGGLPFEE